MPPARADDTGRAWNHNLQYHGLVLRAVPSPCARALDVGCGEGRLTRRLARCCQDVLGIDLEPGVLPGLPENERPRSRVRFIAGDVLTYPLPAGSFDFIAAVATLHHLPVQAGLTRMRGLLAPGGTLVVIGLYRARTLADYIYAAVALPVSWVVRRQRGYMEMLAPARPPEQTLRDIRHAARALLPGAVVKRRFFFRYSLVWRKPE